MARLSNLAARFRDAISAEERARDAQRVSLLADLEAFARQAEVFDVKKSKKTGLSVAFRGRSVSFAPSGPAPRVSVTYDGAADGEHLDLVDGTWTWSHGSGRGLLDGGLEELLHAAIAIPIEVPEPPPAPEPVHPPRPARATPTKAKTPSPPATDSDDNVQWVLADKIRADLVCYSGRNCSGRQQFVQVFPGDHRKGQLDGGAFQSAIVAGSPGTRVVFATGLGDNWEKYPWRAVVITEKNSFPARNGKRAVRIPDLDVQSRHDARYAAEGIGESYDLASTLDEGTTWTFGRVGDTPLKNHVRTILVDRVERG